MANTRLDRLRKVMSQRGIEAVWITGDVNRQYLTGFTGSSGYVLVTADKKSYLLTDFRYMTQAAEEVTGFEIIEHGASVTASLKELLSELKVSTLGFEEENVVFSVYRDLEQELSPVRLEPITGLVEELRMVKDDEELALMKQAAELADQTFLHMLSVLRPGVTEREMALEIEIFMRRHGAKGSCFDTIVASGERSALPHGVASDRVLQKDEFVKMDFGALLNGYCSDITRTVMLGNPTPKHREIYDIVLEAQLHTLEHLRPGMTGKEADALARDIITRYGYGERFGHSTGHGLGMEVHEFPRLSKLSDTVLEPGMVVTVEPGIYIPGFGGVRIEDDVVITSDGARRLTESSKEFTVISS